MPEEMIDRGHPSNINDGTLSSWDSVQKALKTGQYYTSLLQQDYTPQEKIRLPCLRVT